MSKQQRVVSRNERGLSCIGAAGLCDPLRQP
jgi:hypothetical protein